MKNLASAVFFILALLALPQGARAQMGDVGMAMGAAGALATNPIAQQSQMTQQAAAVANGQQAAAAAVPAAAPVPAAPGAAAPAPGAATAGAPAATGAAAPAVVAAAPAPSDRLPADLHSPFKKSLFFSTEDIIAIQKAINGQVRGGPGSAPPAVIPMRRYITIAGISYKTPDNWVVWINGQKVVPGGLGVLKELVDMNVHKDYVKLRWYDIGADKALNITMRPNETYYIVEGVKVPGPAVP